MSDVSRPRNVAGLFPDEASRAEARELFGRMVALAFARGVSRAEAEELAQEVVLHVWRKGDEYAEQAGKSRRSWMLKVAQNRLTDLLRSRRKVPLVADYLDYLGAPSGSQDAEWEFAASRAAERRDRVLSSLNEKNQAVVEHWVRLLRLEITREEAGRALDMSVAQWEAAKKRVGRAIKGKMEELGYDEDMLFEPRRTHDARVLVARTEEGE